MRFASEDIHQDTPRPLAQCGTYVAPGQDARWRGIKPKSKRAVGVVINTIAARKLSRETS